MPECSAEAHRTGVTAIRPAPSWPRAQDGRPAKDGLAEAGAVEQGRCGGQGHLRQARSDDRGIEGRGPRQALVDGLAEFLHDHGILATFT